METLLGRVVSCVFFGVHTYSSTPRGGIAHVCDYFCIFAHIFVIMLYFHLTGYNERGLWPLVS